MYDDCGELSGYKRVAGSVGEGKVFVAFRCHTVGNVDAVDAVGFDRFEWFVEVVHCETVKESE
jgi:hypothetical protein